MLLRHFGVLVTTVLLVAMLANVEALQSNDEDWDYGDVEVEVEDVDDDDGGGGIVEGEDEWDEDEDDGEEEEARLEEAAAARMLSELPLSQLLALQRQVRRAAHPHRPLGNFTLGGDSQPTGPAAAPAASDGGAGVWEGPAPAGGPAALPLFGPRRPPPPRSSAAPRGAPGSTRRGDRDRGDRDRGDRGGPPPPWEEEVVVEVEEEPPWMPSMMQKSKSKAISKIFQGSVTALAFLAFGGYLLCLIVQAVRNKQQMQMMTMVTPTTPAPAPLVRPVFVSGRRRRRRRRRHAHALAPESHEALARALFLLADGYALYSGFYSPRGLNRPKPVA